MDLPRGVHKVHIAVLVYVLDQVVGLQGKCILLLRVLVYCLLDFSVELFVIETSRALYQLLNLSVVIILDPGTISIFIIIELRKCHSITVGLTSSKYLPHSCIIIFIIDTS
jgi:hypothetical protein